MTAPPLASPPADLAVLDDPVERQRFTRTTTDADGAAVAESAFRITGMHCAACAGIIEHALAGAPGVLESHVSAAGERARVRWSPQRTSASAIVQAIRAAGYDAVPDQALEAREARRLEHRQALWRLFVAAFCAMQVMMLATPSYVTSGDELAPDLRQLLNWGSWLLTWPVLLFSAGPFIGGAVRSLRQRRISMDVPVALGIIVTFVASSGATFDPSGPFGHEVYFDSLTMFVSFLLGGRLLELRARHRVAQVLESAMAGMPETAWRLTEAGQVETVSVRQLRVGDLVRVPMGQTFPADGVVVQGQTQVTESLLTGESRPVDKPCGAAVVAGSVNLGAPVDMRVERTGADTRLEGIVALMREAMSQRPALARAADRWAGPFLWAVLVLAAGAAAVWSVVDPSRAVWVAVSVLVVTCPCALSLAAPSAVLAAAGSLARRGVLLQRLDALEALTRIQRVYIDKTGTLTEDGLTLSRVHLVEPATPDQDAQVLAVRAASLAGWSSHPLAQALARDPTLQQRVAQDGAAARWQQVLERPGQGVQARDAEGVVWRLGSAGFVGGAEASAASGARLWFGPQGRAVVGFELAERLRADAQDAVRALRADGLEVVLLSGDAPDRVAQLAKLLPLTDAIAGATPESKLKEIEQAQGRGQRVAMVGDGVNDAPVLARADVSLAMGQGALISRSQADAVVASGRLMDIAHARVVARRCMRIVRQNIVWAAAYNAACIPLALAGWLPPWAAGLGMATSSLLVIGNSLRLMRP